MLTALLIGSILAMGVLIQIILSAIQDVADDY